MTAPPTPANTPPPPRKGTWVRAQVDLADGTKLEIRLPNCVAGSVSTYVPEAGEVPSLVLETREGARRRGRLTQIFGE